jgi:probable DNA metabolism protein
MKYIFLCEDSIDGILTAIYDGFELKKREYREVLYPNNIFISIDKVFDIGFFCEYYNVITDSEKANKTAEYIKKKLGFDIYAEIIRVICSEFKDKASILFSFLVMAFEKGRQVINMLSDDVVIKINDYSKKVANEAHRFNGFIRFNEYSGVLVSIIAPKSNVLPLIADHFYERFYNENFIIYDEKRKSSIIHKSREGYFLRENSELEIEFKENSLFKDEYEYLFKVFFDSVNITERKNERCQRNMLPKWYRKNMNEFN